MSDNNNIPEFEPEQPQKRPYLKHNPEYWAQRKEGKGSIDRRTQIPVINAHNGKKGVLDTEVLERAIDEKLANLRGAKELDKDKDAAPPRFGPIKRNPVSKKQEVPPFETLNLKNLGDEMIDFISNPSYFWLKDYFIYKGLPTTWIMRMRKASEYFDFCYEKAIDIMESKFVKLGLKKRNPAQVMFALKQKEVAGWKDIQEVKSEVQISTLGDVVKKAMEAEKKGKKVQLAGIEKTTITERTTAVKAVIEDMGGIVAKVLPEQTREEDG